MKQKYQQLMKQIHVPNALNENVQELAHTTKLPYNRKWRFSIACVLALVVMGLSVARIHTPFAGFVMTACAEDLPIGNENGGIGIAWETAGENKCLFQIQGNSIQTLTLEIQGGVLLQNDTEVTEIRERYTPHTSYGIRLSQPYATLTVTANDKHTTKYLLTKEQLHLSQSEQGTPILVPQLAGDTRESMSGVYAVNTGHSRWLLFPVQDTHAISLSMPYGTSPNGTFHAGIDIPATTGTKILATADGTVSESGFDAKTGKYVVIDHGNGLLTRYHHCHNISVSTGTKVTAGTVIAEVGNSGISTGAHLHFEVRQYGVAQDPITYFDDTLRKQLYMQS